MNKVKAPPPSGDADASKAKKKKKRKGRQAEERPSEMSVEPLTTDAARLDQTEEV